MSIWIAIAAVTAVYGSHRFGSLRREAFDAQRMGSFTLRQKLGSGGMGDVYLAEHRLLKCSCAIKLILPDRADDPSAIARFESEVRSTANLMHPNTIEIYDYGHTNDGTFYRAMEFLPGMNLQEIVDRYGPLPPERVVFLLRQVCLALREAHTVGLIHCDIKPGNIFAAERGGLYDVAKLLDFGLVKSMVPHADSIKLTIDGTVIGSPLFACPETAVGETLDARRDIYSLGATAYFLLTGQPVFSGENPLKGHFFSRQRDSASPHRRESRDPVRFGIGRHKMPRKRSLRTATPTSQLSKQRWRHAAVETTGLRNVSPTGGRKPRRVSSPRANRPAKPTRRHCWLPPINNRRSRNKLSQRLVGRDRPTIPTLALH